MGQPSITVVIETFTLTHEYPPQEIAANLTPVLEAVRNQSYPRRQYDVVVAVDQGRADVAGMVEETFPEFRVSAAPQPSYFGMKNHGFAIASGEVVALLDADCIPNRDWLERIAAAIESADVVAGKTRYRPDHRLAATHSVFDFGHVHGDERGEAHSFNANNAAFRRSVFETYRFDPRARRNGACYLLWRKMKAANLRVKYDATVFAGHGDDCRGWGWIRKHFERGFDTVSLWRVDEGGSLGGSRYLRLGPLAPFGMFLARLRFDLQRILVNRRDLGIRAVAIPYYYAVAVLVRGIETAGALVAIISPRFLTAES